MFRKILIWFLIIQHINIYVLHADPGDIKVIFEAKSTQINKKISFQKEQADFTLKIYRKNDQDKEEVIFDHDYQNSYKTKNKFTLFTQKREREQEKRIDNLKEYGFEIKNEGKNLVFKSITKNRSLFHLYDGGKINLTLQEFLQLPLDIRTFGDININKGIKADKLCLTGKNINIINGHIQVNDLTLNGSILTYASTHLKIGRKAHIYGSFENQGRIEGLDGSALYLYGNKFTNKYIGQIDGDYRTQIYWEGAFSILGVGEFINESHIAPLGASFKNPKNEKKFSYGKKNCDLTIEAQSFRNNYISNGNLGGHILASRNLTLICAKDFYNDSLIQGQMNVFLKIGGTLTNSVTGKIIGDRAKIFVKDLTENQGLFETRLLWLDTGILKNFKDIIAYQSAHIKLLKNEVSINGKRATLFGKENLVLVGKTFLNEGNIQKKGKNLYGEVLRANLQYFENKGKIESTIYGAIEAISLLNRLDATIRFSKACSVKADNVHNDGKINVKEEFTVNVGDFHNFGTIESQGNLTGTIKELHNMEEFVVEKLLKLTLQFFKNIGKIVSNYVLDITSTKISLNKGLLKGEKSASVKVTTLENNGEIFSSDLSLEAHTLLKNNRKILSANTLILKGTGAFENEKNGTVESKGTFISSLSEVNNKGTLYAVGNLSLNQITGGFANSGKIISNEKTDIKSNMLANTGWIWGKSIIANLSEKGENTKQIGGRLEIDDSAGTRNSNENLTKMTEVISITSPIIENEGTVFGDNVTFDVSTLLKNTTQAGLISAGNELTLKGGGTLENEVNGNIESRGTFTTFLADITNKGTLYAEGDLTFEEATKKITNHGKIYSKNKLTLHGETLTNRDEIAGKVIEALFSEKISNKKDINAANSITLKGAGVLKNKTAGRIRSKGFLSFVLPEVTNRGLLYSESDLTFAETTKKITNHGKISSKNKLTLHGETLTNTDEILGKDIETLFSEKISNKKDIIALNSLTLNGAAVLENETEGRIISNTGDILFSNKLTHLKNLGVIFGCGSLQLSELLSFTNEKSIMSRNKIILTFAKEASFPFFENAGILSGDKGVEIKSVAKPFVNKEEKSIQSSHGHVTITAPTITNAGTIEAAQGVTLQTPDHYLPLHIIHNYPTGTINSSQTVTLSASNVRAQGTIRGDDISIINRHAPFIKEGDLLPTNMLILHIPHGFQGNLFQEKINHGLALYGPFQNIPKHVMGHLTLDLSTPFSSNSDLVVEGFFTLKTPSPWVNTATIIAKGGSKIETPSFVNRKAFVSCGKTTFVCSNGGFDNFKNFEVRGEFDLTANAESITNHQGANFVHSPLPNMNNHLTFTTQASFFNDRGNILIPNGYVTINCHDFKNCDAPPIRGYDPLLSFKQLYYSRRHSPNKDVWRQQIMLYRLIRKTSPDRRNPLPLSIENPVEQQAAFSVGGAKITTVRFLNEGSNIHSAGVFEINGQKFYNLTREYKKQTIKLIPQTRIERIGKKRHGRYPTGPVTRNHPGRVEIVYATRPGQIVCQGPFIFNDFEYHQEVPKKNTFNFTNTGYLKGQYCNVKTESLYTGASHEVKRFSKDQLPFLISIPLDENIINTSFSCIEKKKDDPVYLFKPIEYYPIELPSQEELQGMLSLRENIQLLFEDVRESHTHVSPWVAIIDLEKRMKEERFYIHPHFAAQTLTRTLMNRIGVPNIINHINNALLHYRFLEMSGAHEASKFRGIPLNRLTPQFVAGSEAEQFKQQQWIMVRKNELEHFEEPSIVYNISKGALFPNLILPQKTRDLLHFSGNGHLLSDLECDITVQQNMCNQGVTDGGKFLKLKVGGLLQNNDTLIGDDVSIQTHDFLQETQIHHQYMSNGFRTVLENIANIQSRKGDMYVEAAHRFVSLGSHFKSARNMCLFSGDEFYMEAKKTESHKKKHSKRTTLVHDMIRNHKSFMEVGGDLSLESNQRMTWEGLDLLAKKGLSVQAKTFDINNVFDEDYYRIETKIKKRSGFFKSKKVKTREKIFRGVVRDTLTVDGDIFIQTMGDIHLHAPKITCGGKFEIDPRHGKVFIHIAKELHSVCKSTQKKSSVWQSSLNKGHKKEYAAFMQLCAKGFEIHGEVVVEDSAPRRRVSRYSTDAFLKWMEALSKNPNATWKKIDLQNKSWHKKVQGLTPAAQTLLAIAISIATQGMGAELLNFVGTPLLENMGNAAFINFVSQTTVSCINNKGNLSKVVKALTQSQAAVSFLTSVASAGLTEKLGCQELDTFTGRLQNAGVQNIPTTTISILRGSDIRKSLTEGLLNIGVNLAGTYGAKYIGDLYHPENTHIQQPINWLEHKILHGILGAAMGAALSKDRKNGAFSGLFAPIAAEILAKEITPSPEEFYKGLRDKEVYKKLRVEGGIDRKALSEQEISKLYSQSLKLRTDIVRMVTATLLFLAKKDVSIGDMTSSNALQNNHILTNRRNFETFMENRETDFSYEDISDLQGEESDEISSFEERKKGRRAIKNKEELYSILNTAVEHYHHEMNKWESIIQNPHSSFWEWAYAKFRSYRLEHMDPTDLLGTQMAMDSTPSFVSSGFQLLFDMASNKPVSQDVLHKFLSAGELVGSGLAEVLTAESLMRGGGRAIGKGAKALSKGGKFVWNKFKKMTNTGKQEVHPYDKRRNLVPFVENPNTSYWTSGTISYSRFLGNDEDGHHALVASSLNFHPKAPAIMFTHGSKNNVQVMTSSGLGSADHRQLYKFIKKSGIKSKEWVLFSCNTAEGLDSIAENLARKGNFKVTAPTGILYAKPKWLESPFQIRIGYDPTQKFSKLGVFKSFYPEKPEPKITMYKRFKDFLREDSGKVRIPFVSDLNSRTYYGKDLTISDSIDLFNGKSYQEEIGGDYQYAIDHIFNRHPEAPAILFGSGGRKNILVNTPNGRKPANHRQLHKIIENSGIKSKIWVIHSCLAGALEDGVAANLARKGNFTVIAPTSYIHSFGKYDESFHITDFMETWVSEKPTGYLKVFHPQKPQKVVKDFKVSSKNEPGYLTLTYVNFSERFERVAEKNPEGKFRVLAPHSGNNSNYVRLKDIIPPHRGALSKNNLEKLMDNDSVDLTPIQLGRYIVSSRKYKGEEILLYMDAPFFDVQEFTNRMGVRVSVSPLQGDMRVYNPWPGYKTRPTFRNKIPLPSDPQELKLCKFDQLLRNDRSASVQEFDGKTSLSNLINSFIRDDSGKVKNPFIKSTKSNPPSKGALKLLNKIKNSPKSDWRFEDLEKVGKDFGVTAHLGGKHKILKFPDQAQMGISYSDKGLGVEVVKKFVKKLEELMKNDSGSIKNPFMRDPKIRIWNYDRLNKSKLPLMKSANINFEPFVKDLKAGAWSEASTGQVLKLDNIPAFDEAYMYWTYNEKAPFLNVVSHGFTDSMLVRSAGGYVPVNHRVVAKLITKYPGFKGKEIVNLFSCDTGRLEDGFAQHLVNKLKSKGVKIVLAPSKTLWAKDDQIVIINRENAQETDNGLVYKKEDLGEYRLFTPKKMKSFVSLKEPELDTESKEFMLVPSRNRDIFFNDNIKQKWRASREHEEDIILDNFDTSDAGEDFGKKGFWKKQDK